MTCHCGCDQPAKRNFLPGHDQKLRAKLGAQTGGLLGLEELVQAAAAFAKGGSDRKSFL
jgi:hypothetical protein